MKSVTVAFSACVKFEEGVQSSVHANVCFVWVSFCWFFGCFFEGMLFLGVFFEGNMVLSVTSIRVQVSLLIQARHSGP